MYHNQELVCSFNWQEVIKEQENYKLKLQEEKLADKKEQDELKKWTVIETNRDITITPPKYQESLVNRIQEKFKFNSDHGLFIIEAEAIYYDLQYTTNKFVIIRPLIGVVNSIGLLPTQCIVVGTGITEEEAKVIFRKSYNTEFLGNSAYNFGINTTVSLKWVHEDDLEDFIDKLIEKNLGEVDFKDAWFPPKDYNLDPKFLGIRRSEIKNNNGRTQPALEILHKNILHNAEYLGSYRVTLLDLWNNSLKSNKEVTIYDYLKLCVTPEELELGTYNDLSRLEKRRKEEIPPTTELSASCYLGTTYMPTLIVDDTLSMTGISRCEPFEATINNSGTTIKL